MKEKNKEFIIDAMNKKSVLVLPNGSVISGSSISNVDRVSQDINIVEKMIHDLNEYEKEKVRDIVARRKNENMKITEGVIKNIIESLR